MLCFVFAALIVLLDQLFKRWIVLTLSAGGETIIIRGVINLIYVENSGAAFSILPNQRWLLVGIACVAAIILVTILLRYNEGFWGTLGLASVLGGTVGNLIDRVFNGYVVDMFRLRFMNFAIFNIADIFITLGGLTFCVFFIISSFRTGDSAQRLESASDEDFIDESDDEYEPPEEQEDVDYEQLFYDDSAPTRHRKAGHARQRASDVLGQDTQIYYEAPQEQFDNYESDREQPVEVKSVPEQPVEVTPDPEPQISASSTLDALGALESELMGLSLAEDYDVEELLREYGFESDDT